MTAPRPEDFPRTPGQDEIRGYEERGLWRKAGPLADLERHARTKPDQEAVVDSHQRLTWKELGERVSHMAGGLRALGIGPGDRVAVQLPNWAECMIIHLALEGINAVSLPLPPIYRAKEVGYILGLTEAKAMFVVPSMRNFDFVAMVEGLRPKLPALTSLVAVGGAKPDHAGWMSFDEVLAKGARAPVPLTELAKSNPNVTVEIAFTSGSTGDPKGVMHTSNTLTVEDLAHAPPCGLGDHDVFFMPSTLGHQLGFSVGLRLPVLLGAKVVYCEQWDPKIAVEQIEKEGCTFTCTTPTFLMDALATGAKIPTMRTWLLAGARVTSALHAEVKEKLPNLRVGHVFGMTEIGGMIIAAPKRSEDKILATGQAQPGFDYKVIDDDGKAVGPNVDGELVARGPSLFLGYYKHEALTAESFTEDGYFRTGDQVRLDDDGWVHVTGRVKDLIKRGGENISPAEIEEVLSRHPAIAEVAIVGAPDLRLGERVCAFVVPRPGQAPTLDELIALARDAGLAKQKWPERLEIIDTLPKTSIGKVHKNALRKRLAPM